MTLELRLLAETEMEAFRQAYITVQAESLSKIKRARPHDVQTFCQQQFDYDISNAIASPHEFFLAIVHINTQEVVGSLWYQLYDEPIYSDLAFISWLGIYPDFRRKGYATQALAKLETRLKQQGIDRIALQAYNSNINAMNLYAECGFAAKRTILHKYIDLNQSIDN